MLEVMEIFKSIDGEGKRVGQVCIFIRLFGCNLRCFYCDTKYANGDDRYSGSKLMSVEEIIHKLKEDKFSNCKKITLTGGEPLYQEESIELIKSLLDNGYEVNVETNGSIDLSPFSRDIYFYTKMLNGDLFFTMDWKCKGSGQQDCMDMNNLKLLNDGDVLKFVVSSRKEMEDAKGLINSSMCKAKIYFSPVFGTIEYSDIVDFIKEQMPNAVMQIQLHKIIWDPDMRGV